MRTLRMLMTAVTKIGSYGAGEPDETQGEPQGSGRPRLKAPQEEV